MAEIKEMPGRFNIHEKIPESLKLRNFIYRNMINAGKRMRVNALDTPLLMCRTFEKRSSIAQINGKQYYVFDIHQLEFGSMLSEAFYMDYSNVDTKKGDKERHKVVQDICTKKLELLILLYLSEHFMMTGQRSKSIMYVYLAEAVEIESELKMLLGRDNNVCRTMEELNEKIIEFYKENNIWMLKFIVYHEIAHLKYMEDENSFDDIMAFVHQQVLRLDKLDRKEGLYTEEYTINMMECACDIYAFRNLFFEEHREITRIIRGFMILMLYIGTVEISFDSNEYKEISLDHRFRYMVDRINILFAYIYERIYTGDKRMDAIALTEGYVRFLFEKYHSFLKRYINMLNQKMAYTPTFEEPELFSSDYFEYAQKVQDFICSLQKELL